MRATVSTGAVDLLTFARHHFEAGRSIAYSSIARLYQRTLANFGITQLADSESHGYESYAVIGSFAPNQWQGLLRGNVLRIGQATLAHRIAAENLMKDLGAAEVVTTPGTPELLEQWTEYAPKGLPASATLRVELKSVIAIRNFAKIQQPDGSIKEGFMDWGRGHTPAQLASGYAKGGYYKSLEHALTEMKRARYQVFERQETTIFLDLLPSHMLKETFLGSPIRPKIVGYDEWPKAARDEFESTFRREFRSDGSGGD